MAKLSSSYFLVLMILFSAFLIAERAEGKRCYITIVRGTPCDGVDCRLSCYALYNGVGKCFDDPKVPGRVTPSMCVDSIAEYLNGDQYGSDYAVIADYALAFAKTVQISGDGKDVWIFDIDETLLSNIGYYRAHGYGSEPFESNRFNEWVVQGTAPAFAASLRLYNALKKLGFTIVLLTGRDEDQRSATETNIQDAGYSGWETLLLRGTEDQGKPATIYKSEQRSKLIEKGFKIPGNTGDQWSDLLGFAVADRSFKVPNPIYYIP